MPKAAEERADMRQNPVGFFSRRVFTCGMQDHRSDAQLLRDYASHGDELAFREILSRHGDLVYSAALRQVNSPDSAADIAQSVFLDLAHKSESLTARFAGDASIVGWLYRSSCFAAAKNLRDNARRALHERQAMEQLIADSGPSPDWETIRPMLDEGMASLTETDREALLLRYFNNRGFRDVGLALGVSDDTAQKRVSRALDRLRTFFSKRGVSVTAGGIAAVLSAKTVQAAPAQLTANILTAVSTAKIATLAAGTKVVLMTTLQKSILAATVTAIVGAGLYETRKASQLSDQLHRLEQQQAPMTAELEQLRREREETARRLAALQAENEKLDQNTKDLMRLRNEVAFLKSNSQASQPTASDDKSSRASRVELLKKRLGQNPDATIPELKYLEDKDWEYAARGPLETFQEFRKAFAELRNRAESNFTHLIGTALDAYLAANNGQFPSDVSQLKPFFETPPEDAILDRYEITSSELLVLDGLPIKSDRVITVKYPIDSENDYFWYVGSGVSGSTRYQGVVDLAVLAPAIRAYMQGNNNEKPKEPSDILPYITTPEQKLVYNKIIGQMKPAPK